jgi:hypothetical protein
MRSVGDNATTPDTGDGKPIAAMPGTTARWPRFVVGLAVLMLFAFGALPALQRWGPVRDLRDAIQSSGTDATALFYTESDASCEAEMSIRDALEY